MNLFVAASLSGLLYIFENARLRLKLLHPGADLLSLQMLCLNIYKPYMDWKKTHAFVRELEILTIDISLIVLGATAQMV